MKKKYQSPSVVVEMLEVSNLLTVVSGNAGLQGGGASDEEARGRSYDGDDDY